VRPIDTVEYAEEPESQRKATVTHVYSRHDA